MLTATLRRKMRLIPSKDTADLGFRRLRYVRYCDDHLLGFAGPKAEAQDIKNRVAAFLRDELNLELSQSKTLITHARTGAARFLGYEITVEHADHKVTGKRRSINGAVGVPSTCTWFEAGAVSCGESNLSKTALATTSWRSWFVDHDLVWCLDGDASYGRFQLPFCRSIRGVRSGQFGFPGLQRRVDAVAGVVAGA